MEQQACILWATENYIASFFLYKYYLASFSLIDADITAAIGLCLEKLTKKELETTKDVLNSILQGVSCEFTPVH